MACSGSPAGVLRRIAGGFEKEIGGLAVGGEFGFQIFRRGPPARLGGQACGEAEKHEVFLFARLHQGRAEVEPQMAGSGSKIP